MIKPEDLITGIDCLVKLERSRDDFQVIITDLNNQPLQNLEKYNLLNGDVLTISGLAFKVVLDDLTMAPHHGFLNLFKDPPLKPICIDLKRKMDINGTP